MSRFKSIYDEKTKTIKQVPADNAARLEVLERDIREGRIKIEDYTKQKALLEKAIADEKAADGKAQDLSEKKQADEREAVLKISADKKKAALEASIKRSAEKAKRKEGK